MAQKIRIKDFTGDETAESAMMIQYLTFGNRFNLYFWFFLGISMATLKVIRKEKILSK